MLREGDTSDMTRTSTPIPIEPSHVLSAYSVLSCGILSSLFYAYVVPTYGVAGKADKASKFV